MKNYYMANNTSSKIQALAIAGLIAKGIVYLLLGVLTFMAAFHIDGHSAEETNKDGVFDFIHEQTGGKVMLSVVALGLFCYVIWRLIQAVANTEGKDKDAKGLAVRARYLLSGIIYASVAVHVVMKIFAGKSGSGDRRKDIAAEILKMPLGEWLVGLGALILAGVGVYQLYYGFSGKYKKHVEKAAPQDTRKVLIGAGKVGYMARGVVWLLLAWLFFKAALYAKASEAGDTSKAFLFIHNTEYGKFLLSAVGFGLVCYAIFNFIRARYEKLT